MARGPGTPGRWQLGGGGVGQDRTSAILHEVVELVQVDPGPQSIQMPLEPAGDAPVDALLIEVGLDDRHDPVHGTLQGLPALPGVLDAEHAA